MKYVFMLTLLIIAGAGALMGGVVAFRWVNNMTETPRIMPGERNFPMPSGVLPRGAVAIIPKDQRDVAAREPNPVNLDARLARVSAGPTGTGTATSWSAAR